MLEQSVTSLQHNCVRNCSQSIYTGQQDPCKAFSGAGRNRPHRQGGFASCLEEGTAAQASSTAWLQQGSHRHQRHTHGSSYCCHVSQRQWVCLIRRYPLYRLQVSTCLSLSDELATGSGCEPCTPPCMCTYAQVSALDDAASKTETC